MRRVTGLAAALALLVLLGGVAQADAKTKRAPRVPANWIGMMADGPMTAPAAPLNRQWRDVRRSGASFARVAFYWPQLQPASDRVLDWRTSDAPVLAAARRGLRVLPVVLGTPDWAAARPGVAGSPPRAPADYAALMRALVARYGPGGVFWRAHPEVAALPVRAWQVWNEPSLPSYWAQKDWAGGYVALLRAAHRALKAADPRSTVVLAGLPNFSWRDLGRLYRAGARRAFDVAAVHAYTGSPSGVVEILRRNRRVMRRYGDARKPVWLTELAWPSSKGRRPGTLGWEVTERTQAARIRAALPMLARHRAALRLGRIVWYTWLSVEDHRTWQSYAGLRRLRHGRVVSTPAYYAFRRAVRLLRR